MYSYEDRIRAVKLYFKYGGKTAMVVRELGYSSGKNLKRWVHIYQALGDFPKHRRPRLRYTLEQKRAAVDYYFGHGCSLANTRRVLWYPSSEVLGCWIEEVRPGSRRMVTSTNTSGPFASDQKRQAVTELCARQLRAGRSEKGWSEPTDAVQVERSTARRRGISIYAQT